MEMLLVALAGVGLIMMILGRHMMIRDTGGDLSFFWILMLRLVPLSDMLYMVRHYAQAKKGGIISVVGMWLMVPYFGNMLWEQEEQLNEMVAEMAQKNRGHDPQDLSAESMEEMSAESVVAISRWKAEHLAAKTSKIEGLNTHLKTWHDQLQAERVKLTTDPTVVQKFNENVAAYSAFNAVAKEENAELAELQRRK